VSSPFLDLNAPSLQGCFPRRPAELPHGLIRSPQQVLDLIEQERTKHPAVMFTAEAEERLLNQWTLGYYFDSLGHEVVYQQTAEGPEVLAVGDEEGLALRRRVGEEAYRKFKTWMP